MKNQFYVTLAGQNYSCLAYFAETKHYFPKPDSAAQQVGSCSVYLNDDDWAFFLQKGLEKSAYKEHSILTASFSDAMIPSNKIILHAAAIRWNGKAYLITAPSGVGKSTQVRTLQELRPGEFDVICGDRPVLEFQAPIQTDKETRLQEVQVKDPSSDGKVKTIQLKLPIKAPWKVIVHPSPWNGKENWHGAPAAPLGGLILLERGDQNSLSQINSRTASVPVFMQVIQTWKDEALVRKSAELVTHLLDSVPIWKLVTNQVPDSTRLLLETLFSPNQETEMEQSL